MEAYIEKYLRELAVKYNPWYQEEESEDDSQGIIVYQRKIRFEKVDDSERAVWKTFEYVLLIGKYESKPDMESVINTLLWWGKSPDYLVLEDGKEYDVELLEGEGEYIGDVGGKLEEEDYTGISFTRAVLVKFKSFYDVIDVTGE